VPRLGHDRLDDPPVSISRHLQQAADLLRRALVAEELLRALPDGRVLECESAGAAEGGVPGGGEEAQHGEVLRSIQVAGRFAARSDWQADLGDFEREVDRDVRTIAFEDQGRAGADEKERRPIGEQGGRQARRHKASALNFLSMTRRYRKNMVIFGRKLRNPSIFNGAPAATRTRGPSARRKVKPVPACFCVCILDASKDLTCSWLGSLQIIPRPTGTS